MTKWLLPMVTSLLDVITRAASHTYLSWLCFCCRGTIKRCIIWISDILARFLEASLKSKVQFLENRGSQHSSATSGVMVFFYQTSNGRRSIARTASSLSKVITQSVALELRPWVSGVAGSLPAHLWSKQMPIHLLNLNRFTSESFFS